MLQNLINSVMPFLALYGTPLLITIGCILALIFGIALLIVASKLIKPACDFLETLAEKNLSEKVGKRVSGAVQNLEDVLMDLVIAERELIEKMGKEAYKNDGKIDVGELKEIAEKVGKLAMSRITPDHDTFKKYISGTLIYDYILGKATSIITQTVGNVLESKMGKK